MISPKEASTVPPGTPGAPMANNPNNRMNKVIYWAYFHKAFGIQ